MKELISIKTLVFVFLAAFSGCVTGQKGPLYSELKVQGGMTPADGKAMVFVYSHHLPVGKEFDVWANDKMVSSTMGFGKFFCFQAEPGHVRLASRGHQWGVAGPSLTLTDAGKAEHLDLVVQPGRSYFVDMHNGFMREKMELVSTQEGQKEIRNCYSAQAPEAKPTP